MAMNSKRYSLAGGLAIVQAIIFPLAVLLGMTQWWILGRALHYRGPTFGPSDVLLIIFAVLSVYTLSMFRKMLNDDYGFHGIDVMIIIAIVWGILIMIAYLGARAFIIAPWPTSRLAYAATYSTFIAFGMLGWGIVDILIALQLLRIRENLNTLLQAFVYVTLAAGILRVTVFLSPLALLLVPVSFAILGVALLREKEVVEFV
jgi:hypothetical protein